MNSLEALEELSLMINREKHINSEWNKKINDLKQTIKQDLEYLEQLNKENLDLMSEIQEVHKENLTIKEIKKELERLRKENQELIVNKNVAQAVAFDQKREIGELKDQISYLKEDGEEWQSAYEWSQSKNAILKLKIQELEEENQKLKKEYNLLDTTMESDDRIICELLNEKEQLKNDIKLNEAQIDDLTLEVANYKHALEEKNEIIMDLKEKIEIEKFDWFIVLNNKLDRYKKAIDILKDKKVVVGYLLLCPTLENYNRPTLEEYQLTQQEYELLKEVFGNE